MSCNQKVSCTSHICYWNTLSKELDLPESINIQTDGAKLRSGECKCPHLIVSSGFKCLSYVFYQLGIQVHDFVWDDNVKEFKKR